MMCDAGRWCCSTQYAKQSSPVTNQNCRRCGVWWLIGWLADWHSFPINRGVIANVQYLFWVISSISPSKLITYWGKSPSSVLHQTIKFHMFVSPFSTTYKKKIRDECNEDNYGLVISTDSDNNCAFMYDIEKNSSVSKMFSTNRYWGK